MAVASVLRESTLRTWRNIVALALDEEVDFVLVAGDVFEQANRTLRGQVRFLDGLTELSAAGISSFVITGNHDPLSGWEPSLTWPALAYRFPAHRVTSKPMLKNGEEIARIYGVSYHVRDVQTNLAVGFHREEGSPFAIGLLHANVGGLDGAANYAPCTLTDLRASGMDYWALGHVHRNRVLADGQPTVVYCGSPQGCDPTETHAGGVYIVTVEDGEIRPHFRPVDCVRWRRLDVAISGLANEQQLIDHLAKVTDAARSETERSVVVRISLTGRGPLHESLQRKGLIAELRSLAQEQLGDAEPFAWIESVRDETRADLDVDARRLADDFLGDLLRRLEAVKVQVAAPQEKDEGQGDAMGAGELAEILDELYEHERARRYLRELRPDKERLLGLLDAAEAAILDRLASEG